MKEQNENNYVRHKVPEEHVSVRGSTELNDISAVRVSLENRLIVVAHLEPLRKSNKDFFGL